MRPQCRVVELQLRLSNLRDYTARSFADLSPKQDVGKAAGDAMTLRYAGVIRLHLAIFGLFAASMGAERERARVRRRQTQRTA